MNKTFPTLSWTQYMGGTSWNGTFIVNQRTSGPRALPRQREGWEVPQPACVDFAQGILALKLFFKMPQGTSSVLEFTSIIQEALRCVNKVAVHLVLAPSM